MYTVVSHSLFSSGNLSAQTFTFSLLHPACNFTSSVFMAQTCSSHRTKACHVRLRLVMSDWGCHVTPSLPCHTKPAMSDKGCHDTLRPAMSHSACHVTPKLLCHTQTVMSHADCHTTPTVSSPPRLASYTKLVKSHQECQATPRVSSHTQSGYVTPRLVMIHSHVTPRLASYTKLIMSHPECKVTPSIWVV